MINAIENRDNSDPVLAARRMAPAGPVYIQNKIPDYSNIYKSLDLQNLFALSVEMSLAQIGIFNNPSLSSGSLFSSEPEQQELMKPFLGSLLESLESQNVRDYQSWIDGALEEALEPLRNLYPSPWFDTSINASNSGVFGALWYQGHNYALQGKIEGLDIDLLRLIQKISPADTGTFNNRSSDPSVFSLLLSFQDLIRFSGQTGRNLGNIKVLGDFLRTLSTNIQGVKSTGNFINAFY